VPFFGTLGSGPSPSALHGKQRGLARYCWAMSEEHHVVARSLSPEAAWNAVQLGFGEILDLRTGIERRRYGAPPGARPVSLAKHMASPEGPGAIYLCQRAIRSKATLRRRPRSRAASPHGRILAFQSRRLISPFGSRWCRGRTSRSCDPSMA
jgi:hypothetical protein